MIDQRKLRDCLGMFSTGIIIACARKKNFFAENINAEKILHNKVFSKKVLSSKFLNQTSLGKSLLEKLKEIFASEFFGMTINSFTSASLAPPLISFYISNNSANLKLFKKNKFFSLNILSETQQELARGFATPKNSTKWGIETYFLGKNGNPIFKNSIAFFECKKTKMIKIGDHHLIVGEVVDFSKLSEAKPLLYFQGKYT
ncbi:MAG: flavin reductase family protein [Rickettsiales bacterium]|nr:flavin reductase family protein [Rickettsiales bacterium]